MLAEVGGRDEERVEIVVLPGDVDGVADGNTAAVRGPAFPELVQRVEKLERVLRILEAQGLGFRNHGSTRDEQGTRMMRMLGG